jgi:hypothetical protein
VTLQDPQSSPPPAEPRPVLSYAPPKLRDSPNYIARMRFWHSMTAFSFVALIYSAMALPLLVFVAILVLLLISVVLTLVYMTQAAVREGGTGYAVKHLVVAIVLSPILLLGVFLVPLMVQADVARRRMRGREEAEFADA